MREPTPLLRARWIGAAVRGLDALLYPAVCSGCGHDLFDDASLVADQHDPRTLALHPHCLAALRPRDAIQLQARPAREGVEVHSLFDDSPGWFALLHRIKYGGEFVLMRACAQWLAEAVRAGDGLEERTLIVPVPDDPARRRERGFSPVGELARHLGSALGAQVRHDLLRRARSVPSQTTLPDDGARAANLAGVFRTGDLAAIAPGRMLVLLEDQVTSGATVQACVARLGARGHRLAVLALARAARTPARVHP